MENVLHHLFDKETNHVADKFFMAINCNGTDKKTHKN